MNKSYRKVVFCMILSLCFVFPTNVFANADKLYEEETNNSVCLCGQHMEKSYQVIAVGHMLYSSYYCNECELYVPREFIGADFSEICTDKNHYNFDENTIDRAVEYCPCGGTVYGAGMGIREGYYTTAGWKTCIYSSIYNDEVRRYYYWNIMKCARCLSVIYLGQTQYYTDETYCSHTYWSPT